MRNLRGGTGLSRQEDVRFLRPRAARAEENTGGERKVDRDEYFPPEPHRLLDGATGSIVALSKMVADIDEYNDLSLILSPLVERLETDLEKIGEVIADTLGDIKVLVCTDFIDDDGRQYVPGTFYKAILEPKEIPGETVFLQ